MGGSHTLIEIAESLVSLASPDFCEAYLDGVLGIFLAIGEPLLKFWDAEDGLKCCVDPTGSILVAKTEHCVYLKKAEKSVRNGTGSVLLL
jgi:hypothetical protein